MKTRNLKPILALIATATLLTGCAGGYDALPEDLANRHRTGFRTWEGIPYTGSDPRLTDEKQTAIGPTGELTEAQRRNRDWAQTVTSVDFQPRDGQNQYSRTEPQMVLVKIKTQDADREAESEFTGQFRREGYGLKAELQSQNSGTLVVTCDDIHCSRQVELTWTQNQKQMRILGRSYSAVTRVRANRSNLQPTPILSRIQRAWVTNWEIPLGPSYHRVDFFADTQSFGTNQNLFAIWAPSVQTNDYEAISRVLGSGSELPVEVEMVGDAITNDRRTYRLKFQSGAEALLDVLGSQTSRPRSSPPSFVDQSGAFLRSNLEAPLQKKMVEDFHSAWSLAGVQSWISIWKGAQPETRSGAAPLHWRTTAQNFFINARPFREMIEKIYGHFGVSPSLAYNMPVESPYFTESPGRYPVASPQGSSALGPAQLITATAQRMGLRVGGASDERRFFAPSACGAARYWQQLARFIGDGDLSLILLAYKWGESGAGAVVQCMQRPENQQSSCVREVLATVKREPIRDPNGRNRAFRPRLPAGSLAALRDYDLTITELVESNLIPTEDTRYLQRILALHFIGFNPQSHGFEPGRLQQLPASALPPGGVGAITSPDCRLALSGR